MEGITVKITSNVEKVLEELDTTVHNALVRCGREASDRAKLLAPADTGLMRSSIHYKVTGNEVHVVSPKGYSAYVELGTGKYYDGGRKTPWTYKDESGKWHMTHGQRAKPFLKPAFTENLEQYQAIIKDEFSK